MMPNDTDQDATTAGLSQRITAIRGASFGMIVMVVIQFGLGLWVNLYVTLPRSDKGVDIGTAFGDAVTRGPIGLTLHALLGVGLLLASISLLVRAVRLGRSPVIAMTAIGFISVLVAALSGARFIGDSRNSTSLTMGLAAAIAILMNAIVLFTLAPIPTGADDA